MRDAAQDSLWTAVLVALQYCNGFDLDLKGRGKVTGVEKLRIFPWQGVTGDAEVPDTVGGGSGDHQ